MIEDVDAQIPGNVAFLLVDEGEPQATLLHVMEKTYLPVKMLIDNCETGQYCENVGAVIYQQPDSTYAARWVPFARAYVIKVSGDAPNSTLETTSVMTGYDPRVVLCKIQDALSP
ncbi:MAG: hypothetical protein H0X25_16090 [Acidobacteriales bacterium]|nr:hypothetical protein [Terriglobales bacterium]